MKPAVEWAGRAALLVGSVVLTLAVLELGCRLWRGPQWLWHWPNIVWMERRHVPMEWPVCSYIYDRTVGWAPNPGFTSARYNVGADGLRRMPALAADAASSPPVLATGDSFTEGDEVDDDQSWPAYLQGLVGRRVLNAGVGGFGLDQTVLRTEQMAVTQPIAVAVVGFIVDDLRRMEQSRAWDVNKPYFELKDGVPQLRNSPAPPPRVSCDTLPLWQRLFGWSVLIDGIARRQGWMVDWVFDNIQVLPEGTGRQLACPVIGRLARLGVPVLVIAQYDRTAWDNGDAYRLGQHSEAARVLECAAQAGLATFDSFDVVRQAIGEQGVGALYRIGHHSPVGNRLIAETIARELVRQKLLPPSN
jgi:hypothetical protein